MDIDIYKINKYEPRNNVNTIKWRPIYEVIYEAYFIESKTFADAFIQQCKYDENEAQFIPLEMKNNIKSNGNGTRIICTSHNDTSKIFEICCNR